MTNPSEPVRKTPSHAAKKRNRPNIQSVHPPKPVKKTPSRAAKKSAQASGTSRPVKTNAKRRNIIAVASIAMVVVIIAALAYYLIAILPMQSVILTVNNDNVKTGYFLKRVVANPNGDVTSTLQLLEVELIVNQQAAAVGVAPVTDLAIDAYLRDEANSTLSTNTTTDSTSTTTTTTASDTTPTTGTTTTPTTTTPTMSDAQFNKWFKEQLANTGLSAKEYREVAGREIQRQRLTDILSANIPSTMAQVHLWAIAFNSNSAALAAKAKIDGGTDFATVANTIAGQTNGGDQGWLPIAVLPASLETAASTLDVGKCSDPITYSPSSTSGSTTTSYVLLMISEKSDAMAITADQLSILKNNSLNNWLNQQLQTTKVTLHNKNGTTADGITGTLDNTTLTWLDYQQKKLASKRPTSTQTTTTPTTTTQVTTTSNTAVPSTTTATTTSP